MDVCVDAYEEFLERNGYAPTIDELEVFRFDMTLQKFILGTIKADSALSWLTDETLTAAEKYFETRLDDKEFTNETFCCLLKLCANLIVNLTDDAEFLRARYEEKLSAFVYNWIDVYELMTAEKIINAFRDKVLEFAGEENTPCAYFADELSRVFDKRGDFEAAWDSGKKILKRSREVFGENDLSTVNAMNNLALTLKNSREHINEALKLDQKSFNLRKKISPCLRRLTMNFTKA